MVEYPPITLPEDPQEAQRVFNSLPVKDQLDTVLKARGKDRLHYLFLSEHSEELVQQLPELEVFLTIKEIGEKDTLDLISLTTPEQFQFILDLDFWKRDQLDPEKVLRWMDILLESGENKITQFIHATDPEFMALLLKKFLHVTTLESETLEEMERTPLFTLDQFYYIHFKGKRTKFKGSVQALLEDKKESKLERAIVELMSQSDSEKVVRHSVLSGISGQ